MFPPLALADSRHEAFALALAEGAPPAAAYKHAGFPAKNAKARGAALAKDPDVIHRVDYLRCCLPLVCDLQARFAPSTLLLPQTREEMLAFLWQITTGARTITPVQMRAAALVSRIQGWHLAANARSPAPPADASKTARQTSPPAPLKTSGGSHEHAVLAAAAAEVAAADSALTPLDPQRTAQLKSAIADAFLRDIAHLIDPEAAAESAAAAAAASPPWLAAIIAQLTARGVFPKVTSAPVNQAPAEEDPPVKLPTSAELCALPRVDRSQLPPAERFNLKFPHLGIDFTKPNRFGITVAIKDDPADHPQPQRN